MFHLNKKLTKTKLKCHNTKKAPLEIHLTF